ncbi:cytidylyltransferase family protein [Talaromyces proteolyticus]|uniref:Cytidylyltransferase family protein n=1 Tax=Talaromyces proteolyticus TaxID=1131652 RepID=A0AAD4Q016_9EURO|nr:cytidylyltransferase family protein [Talaromyces proteolyticus]KAH8697187.1 cytidylyltransferase family protein [Talaromyces proteolyticus]
MATSSSVQQLRIRYATALKAFIASSKTFEILDTVPPQLAGRPRDNSRSLFILDSSYNPPTSAHLKIATSALEESNRPSRLLLLLATQNADKPSKPALYEDRLVMMTLLAQDLRTHLQSLSSAPLSDLPEIDIGVTKKPYFVDKAAAIEQSGEYPHGLEQVHLTGYDTLIRIFNPKYYPPTHTLQPLEPFLSRHRLRVTMRPDDEWGNREEQEDYLRNLAQGGREQDGAKREWVDRIQLVEGRKAGETPVSSTRARQAAQSNDGLLSSLVPESVRTYVVSQHLYQEE